MLDFPPVREFLALDDQRAALPIYDQEIIDEPAEPRRGEGEVHLDLGETEKETAAITDFNLLKVIGKGSFGKVCILHIHSLALHTTKLCVCVCMCVCVCVCIHRMCQDNFLPSLQPLALSLPNPPSPPSLS